jgi:hypothetical protein
VTETAWRRFLGTSVAGERPRFRWQEAHSPARSAPAPASGAARFTLPPWATTPAVVAQPAWVVEATATDAQGRAVRYQLAYEPFSGRLIGVVRQ